MTTPGDDQAPHAPPVPPGPSSARSPWVATPTPPPPPRRPDALTAHPAPVAAPTLPPRLPPRPGSVPAGPAVDPAPERAVDPAPERAVEPVPERAVEPVPERAVELAPDPAVDSAVRAAVDSAVRAAVDPAVEASNAVSGVMSAPAPSPPAPSPPAPAPLGPSLAPARPMSPEPVHDESPAVVFTPLRADPPPRLFATWWLRYLLFLAQIVGLVAVLVGEYDTGPGEVVTSDLVRVPYALAAVLLVSWSALAMLDAARLVPATRYQQKSRPSRAVVLWLLAFAAPVGAVTVVRWAQDRFVEDADDVGVVLITVAAVLGCFLLVWLPFQYHTRQAHRIGAPARVVAGWFWIPIAAAVGALAINALGLHEYLSGDGFTDWDRTVQVGVVFGLPALTFALATWRATTVFDEVIELRWLRWRTEWEQTLAAMATQPVPGPEIAPPGRRD